MHYSGENMHKTILFLHKSEKYAKMCKEHEEGIVYLCHVGKWIL